MPHRSSDIVLVKFCFNLFLLQLEVEQFISLLTITLSFYLNIILIQVVLVVKNPPANPGDI